MQISNIPCEGLGVAVRPRGGHRFRGSGKRELRELAGVGEGGIGTELRVNLELSVSGTRWVVMPPFFSFLFFFLGRS